MDKTEEKNLKTKELLAFGIAREIVGAARFQEQLPLPISASALRGLLYERYPRLQALASLAIAVNNEYAQADTMIQANDEVVLIPPVSGG